MASLGFVVIGLIEFSFVILMNRASFGTKGKIKIPNVQKMKTGENLKIGTPYQKTRTLNQILAIRYAMSKDSDTIKDHKTDEEDTKSGKVGSKIISSLYAVDITACVSYLVLFICFNCAYFYYHLSSKEFSCY